MFSHEAETSSAELARNAAVAVYVWRVRLSEDRHEDLPDPESYLPRLPNSRVSETVVSTFHS